MIASDCPLVRSLTALPPMARVSAGAVVPSGSPSLPASLPPEPDRGAPVTAAQSATDAVGRGEVRASHAD
jgi:hypothetical protein